MTISRADVVIVAAGAAYPEYLTYQAYVGHPNRPFQASVVRMAFYTKKAIQREVPVITEVRPAVLFSRDEMGRLYGSGRETDRDIADLIDVLLTETGRPECERFDVALLSAPDDPATLHLEQPITGTKVSRAGRPVPITMGQYRYVSESALKMNPRTTDELGL